MTNSMLVREANRRTVVTTPVKKSLAMAAMLRWAVLLDGALQKAPAPLAEAGGEDSIITPPQR
jgi:hypothetical protein